MTDSSESVRQVRTPGRTRELVQTALIAALLCAVGLLAIPLGITPVPLTFQVFIVVLAALLLSPSMAATAVGIYLLLGAAGVPVFAGGKAGLGVLAGPTGGFLIGFMIGAFIGAIVRDYLISRGAARVLTDAIAAASVIAVIYLLGWVQLMMVTGLGPVAALGAAVLPFVAVDIVKAAAAVGVAAALRRAGVTTV